LTEIILEEEVHDSLFSLQKGKIRGPDGLNMEFYVGFYELLKDDLLKVVRESQSSGKVLGCLNSTFLALIPKNQSGRSFSDYHLISCCNIIYKIISKVIAYRLKLMLSDVISKEQFGFLSNLQIHDVLALAQESLNSIKVSKQEVSILKLDLSKAYDRVSWTFIRLALI
jgi:hypothetical protein